MTVRIRLQFDTGFMHLDLEHLPRIGEGIVLPAQYDPAGPHAATAYRVIDVGHYASEPNRLPALPQRIDVRVAGTASQGPAKKPAARMADFRVGDRVGTRAAVIEQMRTYDDPTWPGYGHILAIRGEFLIGGHDHRLIWIRDPRGAEWGLPACELEHID